MYRNPKYTNEGRTSPYESTGDHMMKKHSSVIVLAVFCIILIIAGTSVSADNETIPALPQAFYGAVVDAGGQPVAAGAVVEARGQGVATGIIGNPFTTTQSGQYGGPGGLNPKLLVQGNLTDGTPITFYVGGSQAQCYDVAAASGWKDTYPFKSGDVTELNLQVGSGTVTYTPTATATATATQTSSSGSTGGGGGGFTGGGGGGFVSTDSSATGTSSTAVNATATATATATTTPGSQGNVSPTQTTATETPTQEMTTVATRPTNIGTGQTIEPLWGIGILIVIIIIGAAAYFYSRQKSEQKTEPEQKTESEQKKE
jgi:hypothetical protein